MEQYLEGRPLGSNLGQMRSWVSLVCRHILVAHTRRDTRVRAFPTLSLRAHHKDEVRWRHNERTAIYKPELAPESRHVGTLTLHFQPQSCERIHLYCLSHVGYGILLCSPGRLTQSSWPLALLPHKFLLAGNIIVSNRISFLFTYFQFL